MSISGGRGPQSVYLSYLSVGVGATVLMLIAIPLVASLGHFPVQWAVIWTAFGCTAATTGTVLLLPWPNLVDTLRGQRLLCAWSLVDVGAIGAVIAATGGTGSWFWVAFVLTTVFFAAGYSWTYQLCLLVATLTTYAFAVVAAGSPLGSTQNLWRVAVIVASFALASFPSLEMRRQTEEHERAREEAHRLAQRLEQREAWWRALIERTTDPILVLDANREMIFVSPAFELVLGYPPEQVRGLDLPTVVHPEDLEDVRVAMALVADGRPTSAVQCRVRRQDGEWRHLEVSFTAVATPGGGSIVANLHDVTKRVEAAAALTHQATHDPLTGLANSRAFYHGLHAGLALARRRSVPLALLLVDLDRFKEANDTFGHAFGDQLLIGVARRLEATLRGADVIARLGGDEFTAVLTTGGDPAGATIAARRLWESLGATMVVAERPLDVHVSIGIACFPDHGDNPDELLRCADHAMYRAKRSRSGVALYQPSAAPQPLA